MQDTIRDHLKTTSVISLFFLAVVGIVSCGGTAPGAAPESPPTSSPSPTPPPAPTSEETAVISFTTVAQEAPLGDEPADPGYAVVTGVEDWRDFQNELPAEAIEAGRNAEQTGALITAFAGAKASSGYQITIKTIRRRADQLVVTVTEQSPGENDIVEPAMTLPFHVVAVPSDEIPEGITAVLFQSESGQTLSQHPYPLP